MASVYGPRRCSCVIAPSCFISERTLAIFCFCFGSVARSSLFMASAVRDPCWSKSMICSLIFARLDVIPPRQARLRLPGIQRPSQPIRIDADSRRPGPSFPGERRWTRNLDSPSHTGFKILLLLAVQPEVLASAHRVEIPATVDPGASSMARTSPWTSASIAPPWSMSSIFPVNTRTPSPSDVK